MQDDFHRILKINDQNPLIMTKQQKKRNIFVKFRNYFITGIVVLIPIGITIYLTLFVVSISSKILPKEINPNHYLPYDIHGLEIIISILL